MPIKAVGVLNKRFPFAKTERIAPEKNCNPEIMFFLLLDSGHACKGC
jgi:hypothetical protein